MSSSLWGYCVLYHHSSFVWNGSNHAPQSQLQELYSTVSNLHIPGSSINSISWHCVESYNAYISVFFGHTYIYRILSWMMIEKRIQEEKKPLIYWEEEWIKEKLKKKIQNSCTTCFRSGFFQIPLLIVIIFSYYSKFSINLKNILKNTKKNKKK